MEDRRGVIVRIVCVIIAILSIYILSIYPVSGVILVQSDKWYSSIYILLLAKLLKDLFECKKKQMKKIGLEVDKNNDAYYFYEKEGFKITGEASPHSVYMEKEV